MLYPRIIPCLLVKNKGLVKTQKFANPKYIGDPINTVKIFNEKEVDELIIIDIEATTKNRDPDYTMIKNLAAECRMPLCYGGGIKTVDQAQEIFSLGVEKIAMSSAVVDCPDLIAKISKRVGSQSVVIVIDVKKKRFSNKYEIWTKNYSINTKIDPIEFINDVQDLGVGEIVINSIERDGMMNGYETDIVDKIKEVTSIPITILGGAGSLEDVGQVIRSYGTIGCAAGSLFVFNGKYKAVLITYPDKVEKERLIKQNLIKE